MSSKRLHSQGRNHPVVTVTGCWSRPLKSFPVPYDRSETARRAGVRMCLARYGFGYLRGETGLDAADWTIDAPGELLPIVEKLHHGDVKR